MNLGELSINKKFDKDIYFNQNTYEINYDKRLISIVKRVINKGYPDIKLCAVTSVKLLFPLMNGKCPLRVTNIYNRKEEF